jgi:hypothetical protein
MAHIYYLWARTSQDSATQKARAAQAEQFYAIALEGKPYRVKLWNEWANFRAEFGDFQGSRQKIDTAFKIDSTYAATYQLSAQLYLDDAEKQSDSTKRAELLNKAIKDLTTEVDMMNRRRQNPFSVLLQLGDVYTLSQQYAQARDAYLQAEKIGLNNDQWQAYQKLAAVSGKLNDISAQREYLKQAIAVAPVDETSALRKELDAIKP